MTYQDLSNILQQTWYFIPAQPTGIIWKKITCNIMKVQQDTGFLEEHDHKLISTWKFGKKYVFSYVKYYIS